MSKYLARIAAIPYETNNDVVFCDYWDPLPFYKRLWWEYRYLYLRCYKSSRNINVRKHYPYLIGEWVTESDKNIIYFEDPILDGKQYIPP